MKKAIKIIGIIVLLLLIAMIALPMVFKGKIVEQIKTSTNENLNATLEFDNVSLSLFSNFPDLSVEIQELDLKNNAPFEGVHLVRAHELLATVNLLSVFGETIEINQISIVEPNIDVRVLVDGTANYDIAKGSENDNEEAEKGNTAEESAFIIALKSYKIENGTISYSDATLPMELKMNDFTHSGSGDFTSSIFDLQTVTEIEELTFTYDNILYINKAKTSIDAGFNIDNDQAKYTFKENKILLNDFAMNADGFVSMPGKDIDMDLSFAALNNDFKSIVSLIPAEFAQDLDGVEASGEVSFDGILKGKYNSFSLPGLVLNLSIEDGMIQYPDLPESLKNVQIDAHLDANKGIDNDDLKLDLNTFHAEIANSPIDAEVQVRTPYSDPSLKGMLNAKVVLENLKNAIPLDKGDELRGTIIADVAMEGKMSAIEDERYDEFDASGQIIVQKLLYQSDSLGYDVDIDKAYLNFSPQQLELSNLVAKVGDSDFKVNGAFDNYIAYLLKNEMIKGAFDLSSQTLNLNQFMDKSEEEVFAESDDEKTEIEAEEPIGVINLPANIDFSLRSQIGTLLYDDIEIKNLKGRIDLQDEIASMTNLSMEVLDGTVKATGSYSSKGKEPNIDMIFNIKNMSIKRAAEQFYSIDKMAPIAKSCQGKFSTEMKMISTLNENMEPVLETLGGFGRVQIEDVLIEKFEPLNKLANELKINKLAKQRFEDLNIGYKFEDGKVFVDPFEVKLDGVPTTIDGSMGFDQSLNYTMKMNLPLSKLPVNLDQQASGLLGEINQQFGTSISTTATIPVSLTIKGTVEKPTVTGNYGDSIQEVKEDIKEQVIETVKEEVKATIDASKAEAIAKAKEEADKMIAEAQKQADSIMEEAQAEAEKLRASGYAEADKLEKKGANFIEKSANKKLAEVARKETDKKVDKLIAEAQERSDKLVANATQKAEDTIKSAEEK